MLNHRRRGFWFALATATVTLLLTGGAMAQRDGPYNLSWHTVDGGGMMALRGSSNRMSSAYTLDGTTGQPDAGQMAGGGFTLGGGFWGGGAAAPILPDGYGLYLPLVLR